MKTKTRQVGRLTIFFIVSLFLIGKFSPFDRHKLINRPVDFCRREKPALIYVNLLYIPSMKILFCHIPKAASTNLRRFLHHYLHRSSDRFVLSQSRRDVWTTIENDFNPFYLHKDNRSREILQLKIFKFLLVRHPLRRIYAAFKDKFLDDHEEDALFGWKSMEEQILLQIYPNETELTLRRRDAKVNFRIFLLYLVDSIRKQQPMNSHWDLLVRRCGICHLDYDWFGKIENLRSDGQILSNRFRHSQGHSFKFPSAENNRTDLTDEQLIEIFRRTLNNSKDFQTLIDYYTPDFQAFHYSIPSP